MKMTAVKSSNIEGIWYDAHTQMLHVQFKGGSTYAYEYVTQAEHEALMGAQSLGTHLHAHIKSKLKGIVKP